MSRVNVYAYGADSSPVWGNNSVSALPVGQLPVVGGMDFEEEPNRCHAVKRDGGRCAGFCVGGGTLCIGHRNAKEKQERAVDGSVDSPND